MYMSHHTLLYKLAADRTIELRSRLQRLSSTQLEELAEALLDFSSMADLETWLQTCELSL